MAREHESTIPSEWLIRQTTSLYRSCGRPDFRALRKVSLFEKLRNERAIRKRSEQLLGQLEPFQGSNPAELSDAEQTALKRILSEYILDLDGCKLFFDKPFLGFFLEQGYMNSAEDFLAQVRREDSGLEAEAVFQAMRNVWIMNSLQLFWGLPLGVTPSVYAYSMLYPYTDNYLDSAEVEPSAKAGFNTRLAKVIRGEAVSAHSPHEARVFALLGQIEEQYPRGGFGQIYDSIALIQEAQAASLKQDSAEQLTQADILPISILKGGASVLADAFLVKGELTVDEMQFAFGYGAFLQLLDDLQDAASDRNEGHQTLFSTDEPDRCLDAQLERLIAFIFEVNTPDAVDNTTKRLMKDVIKTCTLMMVMEVIGRDPSLTSPRFYRKLERYAKVRLPFFRAYELQMETMFKSLGIAGRV